MVWGHGCATHRSAPRVVLRSARKESTWSCELEANSDRSRCSARASIGLLPDRRGEDGGVQSCSFNTSEPANSCCDCWEVGGREIMRGMDPQRVRQARGSRRPRLIPLSFLCIIPEFWSLVNLATIIP